MHNIWRANRNTLTVEIILTLLSKMSIQLQGMTSHNHIFRLLAEKLHICRLRVQYYKICAKAHFHKDSSGFQWISNVTNTPFMCPKEIQCKKKINVSFFLLYGPASVIKGRLVSSTIENLQINFQSITCTSHKVFIQW